jgi:hypothetical protein
MKELLNYLILIQYSHITHKNTNKNIDKLELKLQQKSINNISGIERKLKHKNKNQCL